MLDESGEYEDFYNRYCHIGATLGSETSFELLNTDYVNVTLSPEKFKELKIKYVVSRNSIDEKIVSGTVFGENQSSLALNCRSMNVSIKLTVDLCNEQNLKNS